MADDYAIVGTRSDIQDFVSDQNIWKLNTAYRKTTRIYTTKLDFV